MIERPLYLNKIMPFVDTPFVKILTGVRRCGKSTILKMIQKKLKEEHHITGEQILSYRFDSMEYEDMTSKELYQELKTKILNTKKTYLFLDEIQEINGWEKVVNTLASDYDVDIYITGSNSRMMSSEISTYLTGRYVTFYIYTLSFDEYLTFKKSYSTIYNIKQEFNQYVRLGGFPATHLQEYSQDEVYTIVRDIYNSTIFSDIVRRNQVKKIDQLERVVKYTFNNVGNTFSAKSISNYLKSEQRKIDNETVYSYLEKLQKAYILHRCSRYDLQGKSILKTQEKFYLADISLRYAVLGYTIDSVASSLENIVYLELKRRGYDVCIGKYKDKEIDFVATKQNEKIYVQVTQEIKSEKTQKREYEQLLEIKDNYPKYVVLTDDFAGGNYQGIKTMHITDFLLSKEY
ncbi:ATP-binding protein [Faecalibacillus intestinalis]|jgi:predicted AAA+ superfamily ATPase|uniref:ATP-binding protein n=1 Tax=Faecalibacillus intestinalis TaxID=1982626 RepID=A0AAW4VI39_9FIRM|nr:ATP-binding protein [Faecalibacillus intestinalis]RGG32374.1 ATP-binding protein [Coprobacillus sp. AF24-1LB]RHO34472.1 ATP-binding protein [Coprobacillus sp. AM17-34]MCB8561363.1 ATP-binding protein [Faecalibacillus intestinalis]MCG4809197.1 ATP-binding protein [Faecalibacillus intestinalis]MEE1447863.1 ATP-binding protein [Faecalibacillus intestinalis]